MVCAIGTNVDLVTLSIISCITSYIVRGRSELLPTDSLLSEASEDGAFSWRKSDDSLIVSNL